MATSLLQNYPPTTDKINDHYFEKQHLATAPNRPAIHLVSQEGQLQVHTAPYRGSFSGVLSEALRTAGLGSQVMVVQFLKGGVGQGPNSFINLCGRLEWFRPDISCCLTESIKTRSRNEINSTHQEAVQDIWDLCKYRIIQGDVDHLVLDEVGLAISLGYIKEKDLIRTTSIQAFNTRNLE